MNTIPHTACAEDNINAFGGYGNMTDLISAARAMDSYKGACEKGLAELNRVREELRVERARLRYISELWIPTDRSDDSLAKWIAVGDHNGMVREIDLRLALEAKK